jgi:hypothetical protein
MNTKTAADDSKIPDEHLNDVNELLEHDIEPAAGFALGLMTHIGLTTGYWPNQTVLEVASRCNELQDAIELFTITLQHAARQT